MTDSVEDLLKADTVTRLAATMHDSRNHIESAVCVIKFNDGRAYVRTIHTPLTLEECLGLLDLGRQDLLSKNTYKARGGPK